MPIYKVEVNGPHNESLIFSPARSKVRGRWSFAKVNHRDKGEAMKMLAMAAPEIPGMAIELDTEKRKARIYDLLTEPESRSVLKACNDVFKQYPAEFDGSEKKPQETVRYELTQDDVKTWLFVISQTVASGLAVALPSSEAIPGDEVVRLMPGKRLRDPGNTGPQTAMAGERDRLEKWVDDVPAGGKLVAAK